MNKAHFLCLFLSVILFSCFKKEADLPRKTTGKINTISVIIDDQLWNGEIGDSIRNKFASPVIGLPEEEPLFTINQYPVKLLEGFATDSRAILVIKKEAENKFEIKENQYAYPQNVFHISGKTATEILQLLEDHTAEIIHRIEQGEIAESQRINKKALLQTTSFKKEFQLTIQVSSDFEYAMRKPNFVWLKKKTISGSSSLLLYQVPLNTITNSNIAVDILKMRDSIGKYIKGTEPNTYMISETGYTPYFFKSKIDNRLAYETRGTWQLQNDYMSGPFINYTIVDKPNHRLLVLEGFCYSPSKEKRDVMHELEAIIHSVRLLKNNTFTPHKKIEFMALEWKIKSFESLSVHELYDILRLRSEIFVVEQNCVYLDLDGKDQKALHLFGTFEGKIVAHARLFKPGISFVHTSIGRVVVHSKYRDRKWGHELMRQAIAGVLNHFGETEITIGAQLYLKKFYESHGFVQTSEMYLEDDIPHIQMEKSH